MIKFQYEGKDYEAVGYALPKYGDHFVSEGGNVLLNHGQVNELRLIVRPAPVTHTFGNVELEETGEYRCPTKGEWYLSRDGDTPFFASYGDLHNPYKILRGPDHE